MSSQVDDQQPQEEKPWLWKAGQPSPNPGGKPKGLPSFSAALRRELAKTDRRNVQNLEKIAARVVKLAMAGDMDAVRWLADRTDGKVAQNLNVSNEHTVNVVPWLPAAQAAKKAIAGGEQVPEMEGVEVADPQPAD